MNLYGVVQQRTGTRGNQGARGGQCGVGQNGDLLDGIGILLFENIDVIELQSTHGAGTDASGKLTGGTQLSASIALTNDVLLGIVLRNAVRASIEASLAAVAQIAVEDDGSVFFGDVDSLSGANLDAGRFRTVIAGSRIVEYLDIRIGADFVVGYVTEQNADRRVVLVFAGNLAGTATGAHYLIEVKTFFTH